MNDISRRLGKALEFIKKNRLAESESAIARRLGVTASTLTMAKKGTRTPTWELLLNLCDAYPIDFEWLRKGSGEMIKEDKGRALLMKIEQLEEKVRVLEGQLQARQ